MSSAADERTPADGGAHVDLRRDGAAALEWAADYLASWVVQEPGWELCAPRHFSVVCFRVKGSDERNRELLRRVNAGGELFISHAVLEGRYVLRLAVGQLRTTESDMERARAVLRREAAAQ